MSPVLTVDRIENNLVVIETEEGHFHLPANSFSWAVKEGDRITLTKDSSSENELQNSIDRLKRLGMHGAKSDIIDL